VYAAIIPGSASTTVTRRASGSAGSLSWTMLAKGMLARTVATSAREVALAAALNLPARRLAITYRAIFILWSSGGGKQDGGRRVACRHCV
jgi:hypothetical protein